MLTFTFDTDEEHDKFNMLYNNEYRNLLFYKANKILNNPTYSEDVVHDTYLTIAENLNKIDCSDMRKTVNFMITIVKNKAYNVLKKSDNKKVISYDDVNLSEEPEYHEKAFSSNEQKYEFIKSHIEKMDEKYRDLIILKYTYGYKNNEIAKILNISENVLNVRLHRVMKKLKSIFEQKGV